jgi:hypothetical protein
VGLYHTDCPDWLFLVSCSLGGWLLIGQTFPLLLLVSSSPLPTTSSPMSTGRTTAGLWDEAGVRDVPLCMAVYEPPDPNPGQSLSNHFQTQIEYRYWFFNTTKLTFII